MKRHPIAILLGLAVVLATQGAARGGTAGRVDPQSLRTPLDTPEGPAFVRHNGDRFNNRPLYCNQTSAIVVAGDRPFVRFGNGSVLDGTFMAALLRGNQARWLHDWSDITAKYRPNRMQWILKDGRFGATIVTLDAVPKCKRVVVELTCQEPLPQYPAVAMETCVGEKLDLSAKDAQTIEPALPPTDAGYHWVESLVQAGDAPQRRVFKVRVLDPKAEAARAGQVLDKAPADARWRCLDLSRLCNGDIRTIFQQQYLSPRPETCSLRLATDGYSTWQMMLGSKHKTPVIDLAHVPSLLESASRLRTPQGVPFAWTGGNRNIALTSMWDNWPRQVVVPVSGKAEVIWLLVCGFTNPMQGRIANAELRMKYADGVVEKLELVPPLNFWSLCPFGGSDYDYRCDGFCLPKVPPATVQLGNNCRAILLNRRLRPNAALESVTLETLSQGVIIGLLGASLMNPK